VPTLRFLVALVVVLSAFGAGTAVAAPVLEMDSSGHVHAREDRALPSQPVDPAGPLANAAAVSARPRASLAASEKTVRSELNALLAKKAIASSVRDRYRAAFDAAIRTAQKLSGTRRSELQAVVTTLHDIAARGQLTASRLPALFETLARNRQWWTTGNLMSYGQRVEFSDSSIVWEYYPGQGIQIQVLGTFGRANGLWMAKNRAGLASLLDEMLPMAVVRGRALTWEYYFSFGGGSPPWTSGMSQATGIQAFSRASQLLGQPQYLAAAKRALPLFEQGPPTGVRVGTSAGAHYLQYTYDSHELILNAFLQSLVGLYDYATISNDATAWKLFRAGDRQAQKDVVADDTGAWTLYQNPGEEADLNYQELVNGFVQNLCLRTKAKPYCDASRRWTGYLTTPPVTTLLTTRLRARSSALVRFKLSKRSKVGMTITRDGRTYLSTSAWVSYGTHAYSWTAPSTAGTYTVTLSATDQAGNFGKAGASLTVVGKGTPQT
jgi:hypothetical protein